MSKKVLSFLLLLTLVLGSASTVFATEADLKIPDSVVVEDQITNDEAIVEDDVDDAIDQEVVQGVNMADIEEAISTGNFAITPRAVGYVMDFAGLKKAVEDPTVNIAVIMNDIQMESMLDIDRDITFLAPMGATITSAPDNRHFNIGGYDSHNVNIVLEFSQVILDGGGISGGIDSFGVKLHLKGVVIQNCHSSSGGGICASYGRLTVTNSRIINNTARNMGGGILIDALWDDEYVGPNSNWNYDWETYEMVGNPGATIANSQIIGNKAEYGGGIATGDFGSYTQHILSITEGSVISENIAEEEGGAIYHRVFPLCGITVSKDVIFSNNKAAEGYFMTDPAHIKHHNRYILTTNFTKPFTYGFNNFDISYWDGDRLAPVTVNYFVKMSDTTPLASVTGYAGQAIGVISTPADPIMENLVFIGWADEDNVFYDADTVITEDLNLYAVWKLK